MASRRKPLKPCSHKALRWDGTKNSGFTWLHLMLMGPTWGSVKAYFKELYQWSCFAKQFNKMVSPLLIEPFMELKPEKTASLVK